MKRACETLWIKVPRLGNWTRLTALPEGPSYRTVIPRPTAASGQVGILSAHNGESPTRHEANHVGRYWHRTGPSLHRPTHNHGSRSGWPVTGTHQSDNPAVAIDQRVRSQELTTLIHSGQQSPISDVSKPQSSTWYLHHTDVKIQKFDKWKHDTKLNSTHKTSHQQGQPEWRRAPLKSVSDMPNAKAGVTRIGRNSGEVCTVKNNFKLNKSRQVDKLWIRIKLQSQKPHLILALGWRWENSQAPDGM